MTLGRRPARSLRRGIIRRIAGNALAGRCQITCRAPKAALRFLALNSMTCNKRAPALFESATKAGARRAAGVTALLLDVLLELEDGCGLFGDELLDGRVPCRHRQRGID